MHIGHKMYPYVLRHLEMAKSNPDWTMCITYIPMAKGFVTLTCIMDIYRRKIRSSVIANTMEVSFCVDT